MKRVISLLLAVVLVISLTAPAYAVTLTSETNKSFLAAGESITISVKLDEAMTAAMMQLEYQYDTAKFDFVSGAWSNNAQYPNANIVADAAQSIVKVNFIAFTGEVTVPAGEVCTLTFQAKEAIADVANAGFGIKSLKSANEATEELPGNTATENLTVSGSASVDGYYLHTSGNQNKIYGEAVAIEVKVGYKDASVSAYNAYDVIIGYDSDILEYQAPATVSGDEVAVTHDAENHTIRITGYGSDKAFATALATLKFTAKAVGVGTVIIQSAKVSNSNQAIDQDAAAAAIIDAETQITVGGYPVTLADGFLGEATVLPNGNYTFTANDKNYNYTFEATVGGQPAQVKDNGDGTFTIENVSGAVEIKLKEQTAKTFAVTVTGDGKDDVTFAATATYKTDYTFTINKDASYAYTVKAQVGNGAAFDVTLDNGTYQIPGADITGDITITVTKTLAQTKVVFSGTGSGDVVNGTEQTAEANKSFTFTITKDADYTYMVKLGETVLTEVGGVYTIPAESMNTAVVEITVHKTADFAVTVAVKEYVKLDGQSIFLVTATGTLGGEDKVLAYGDTAMYWSEKYNAYAWLVISDQSADAVKTAAEAAIQVATATAVNVDYSGNVNGSSNTDINDAQLVYDMYNAKYTSFDAVSILKFLNADINGSGSLSVEDSAAVVSKLVNP